MRSCSTICSRQPPMMSWRGKTLSKASRSIWPPKSHLAIRLFTSIGRPLALRVNISVLPKTGVKSAAS